MIKFIALIVGFFWKMLSTFVIISIFAGVVFVVFKGNQPMNVLGAPAGMSYFEFMRDRVDAAKMVEPSRCGWGMFVSLGILGPIYSAVYTDVAVNPGGFLDRVTAPDKDIPTGFANSPWYQVPNVWWNVVERLSWTMLGRPQSVGCRFRPVANTGK